jgi:hypothetical protein
LRADVHDVVYECFADREPPAWMNELVVAILCGRHLDSVTARAGRPDGGTVLINILADLKGRFALTTVNDGEWWAWTMSTLDLYLMITWRSIDQTVYLLRSVRG